MDEETTQLYVVAVAATVFRDGRVLAMRRAPTREAGAGLWETLSGRVRPDEEPVDAVTREIAEECGLPVRVWPRPVTSYRASRAGSPMIVVVYRADAGAGEVRRSDEHDAHAWLTPDEFAATTSLAPLARAVALAARLAPADGGGERPAT